MEKAAKGDEEDKIDCIGKTVSTGLLTVDAKNIFISVNLESEQSPLVSQLSCCNETAGTFFSERLVSALLPPS